MTTKSAPEEPIVAVYPVPGELHETQAPIPTRQTREEAAKLVKSGAFTYDDTTLPAREAAAKPAKADKANKADDDSSGG